MKRQGLGVALMAIVMASTTSLFAETSQAPPRVLTTTQIYESSFTVAIYVAAHEPKARVIVLSHMAPIFSGPLAQMPLNQRTQLIADTAARFLQNDCGGPDRVSDYGTVSTSADPEATQDPYALHPSFVMMNYLCQ